MGLDSTGVPQALCEFRVAAGHWQPFMNSVILSLIALYIRWNSQSSRDGSILLFY
jgi:hypothetical protein